MRKAWRAEKTRARWQGVDVMFLLDGEFVPVQVRRKHQLAEVLAAARQLQQLNPSPRSAPRAARRRATRT
jgi:hypothetical protein